VFIPGGQLLFFEICFGISIFIYISFAKFVLQMQSFWAFLQRNMKKAKLIFCFGRIAQTLFLINSAAERWRVHTEWLLESARQVSKPLFDYSYSEMNDLL